MLGNTGKISGKWIVENCSKNQQLSTGEIANYVFNRGCGKEKVSFVENFGENVESRRGEKRVTL